MALPLQGQRKALYVTAILREDGVDCDAAHPGPANGQIVREQQLPVEGPLAGIEDLNLEVAWAAGNTGMRGRDRIL